MESSSETTDRNPVAAALERGYARADARVHELAADSGLSPHERYEVLLQEAAVALDPIGEKMALLGERWSLQDNSGWEAELSADLQHDVTIDDEETSRRISVERGVVSDREARHNNDLSAARPELLKHVETLAAHPWKDLDLENAPGHDDSYGAADREQVAARLDGVLKQCGLTATKDLAQDVAPPESVQIVHVWGQQGNAGAVTGSIRNLSFPKAPTLTPPAASSVSAWQKATNFLVSKIQRGGSEQGR